MFLFAATYVVFAQEQEFTQYNCAITPPDGWQKPAKIPPSQVSVVSAFTSPNKSRVIILTIDDRNKPEGPLNERFITGFERGVENAGGGKRISYKFIEIAGIKSYERVGSIPAKNISTLMRLIPADGKYYHLQALRFDGEAQDDPQIVKCLESFRFLTTPKPPPSLKDSAAFQAGVILGKIMGVAVFVGLIVLVIVLSRRKSKATPPPLPPMA